MEPNRCSCVSSRRTSGAVGSVGASLRNVLYAPMAVAKSLADCAAWASSSWTLGSFGCAAAILRYWSTAWADADWISEIAAETCWS